MASIRGCHLVGSVPLADTETVFRKCLEAIPSRLKRIPDGETGSRHYFTAFQAPLFSAYPRMMVDYEYNTPVDNKPFTPEEVDEGMAVLEKAGINTGYDDAAIESYAVFRKLKDEGVIPSGVRFQVCFPTPTNTIVPFVQRAFLPRVEILYEQALLRAMRKVQDEIPHEDLAIQIDLAADTAFWEASITDPKDIKEDSGLSWFRPWWDGDVKERCLSHIIHMAEVVAQDVELGIHNCYGDMNHRHWHEPTSLAAVVDRGIRVMEASPHKINWFHCPVPKSAVERPEVGLDAYFTPLRNLLPYLEQNGTELYLGLVHENKPEVTQQMIEAAKKVVPTFGIATECGGGRMEWEDFKGALEIAKDNSETVA